MQRPTWTRRLMGGSWTQTTKQNERIYIERERMSDTFNPRQIPRLKYCPNWLQVPSFIFFLRPFESYHYLNFFFLFYP